MSLLDVLAHLTAVVLLTVKALSQLFCELSAELSCQTPASLVVRMQLHSVSLGWQILLGSALTVLNRPRIFSSRKKKIYCDLRKLYKVLDSESFIEHDRNLIFYTLFCFYYKH